ncbi:MAG: hypothetical protein WC849_00245 [Candidatus Paceibacterota bacterium]
MTSYILFIISLLGISILFSIKILETEKGRVVISEDIKNHLEKKTRKHLSILYIFASHFNKRTMLRVSKLVYEELKYFLFKIYDDLIKRVKNSDLKIIKIIRGEKTLTKKGSISPFLSNIAEFKKENNLGENKDNEDLSKFEN